MLRFEDETGKPLGFPSCPQLGVDSDWVTLSTTLKWRLARMTLAIEPGVYGPAGELSVDDITVLRNRNRGGCDSVGFPEGTFEKLEADGSPAGIGVAQGPNVKVLEENGNHFLRLVNEKARQYCDHRGQRFTTRFEWKTLRGSGGLRAGTSKSVQTRWMATDAVRVEDCQRPKWLAAGRRHRRYGKDSDWVIRRCESRIRPAQLYVKTFTCVV